MQRGSSEFPYKYVDLIFCVASLKVLNIYFSGGPLNVVIISAFVDVRNISFVYSVIIIVTKLNVFV